LINKNLNKLLYPLSVVLLGFTLLFACHTKITSDLKRDLRDTRNNLANALGSIEIAEGVSLRMGVEVNNLNRQVSELLGENTRLEDLIGRRDSQIRELAQVNASLTETIEFSSNSPGSSVTTTIIDGCNENSNAVVTVGENLGTETNVLQIPNIRTDFNINNMGFNITGYTTTRPAFAHLSLTQIDPFVIDIAITEDRNGARQILVSEQQNRLQLDIGLFSYSRRVDRTRWFERFNVGGTTVLSQRDVMFGPTFGYQVNRSVTLFGGALFNVLDLSTAGQISIIIKPFHRNR
jgi:hypothetical protein